jgi:Cys-tRNA(Pro) deacylase
MQPLTTAHVQRVLAAFDLGLEVITYAQSTATSQQAADAIGCELGQIAKSLCFMVDGAPVLVVAAGDQRVDDKKLATYFEVGRKKVKTAKPEQCITIFGYAPGGVPPVGHRTADIPTLIDDSLQRFERVYAAAGASNANFGITVPQLVTITNGTIMDCKKESG